MAAKSRKQSAKQLARKSPRKPAKTRITREIEEMRKGIDKVLTKRSSKKSVAVTKSRKPSTTAKKSMKMRSSLSTKERARKRQVAENILNTISKQYQVMLTSKEFIIRLTPESYKFVQTMLIDDKPLIYCLIALLKKQYPKYFDNTIPTINVESSAANVESNTPGV